MGDGGVVAFVRVRIMGGQIFVILVLASLNDPKVKSHLIIKTLKW